MGLDAVGVSDTAWSITGRHREYLKKEFFLLLGSTFGAEVCYYVTAYGHLK